MKINCPDCNKSTEIEIPSGKIKCNKCLQYIVIENYKPLCCIPKCIFE